MTVAQASAILKAGAGSPGVIGTASAGGSVVCTAPATNALEVLIDFSTGGAAGSIATMGVVIASSAAGATTVGQTSFYLGPSQTATIAFTGIGGLVTARSIT